MGTEEGLKKLAKDLEEGLAICETCAGTGHEEYEEAVEERTHPRTGRAYKQHVSYVRPCTDPDCGLKKICKTCLGSGWEATDRPGMAFHKDARKPCTDPDCKAPKMEAP